MIKTGVNHEFKLGEIALVLVDTTKSKKKYCRFYSIKQRIERTRGAQWYRCGTLQRIKMTDVEFIVKQDGVKGRESIVKSGKKDVHAYIKGRITAIDISDEEHNILTSSEDLSYVAYDPFKTSEFVVNGTEHLPENCESLKQAMNGSELYLYESSIIYTPPKLINPAQETMF